MRSCLLHFSLKGHLLTLSPAKLRETRLWLQAGSRVPQSEDEDP